MNNLHEMRESLLEAGYTFDQIGTCIWGIYTPDFELVHIYHDQWDHPEAVMAAYRNLEAHIHA